MYLFLYLLNAWHLGKDTSSHVCSTMLLLHLEIGIFRTDNNLQKTGKKKCKVAEAHYPRETFMSISKIQHIYSCNSSMSLGHQLHPALKWTMCQKREPFPAVTQVQSRTWRVTDSSLLSPTSVPSGPSLVVVLQRSELSRSQEQMHIPERNTPDWNNAFAFVEIPFQCYF